MLTALGCMNTGNHYAGAGFAEGIALFMITDTQSYPAWILPHPVDPEKFGNYEDEDDD